MRLSIRAIHKYLSFFISLQLLLWTVSGIYFAFNKIELIRGEQYRIYPAFDVQLQEFNFDVSSAWRFRIINRLGENVVVVKDAKGTHYLDKNGVELLKLGPEQAKEIVHHSTNLTPLRVVEISKEKTGSEYRGKALPLYQVVADDGEGSEINVYIHAHSGEIVALRSPSWRIWDLMWGLHIMDWRERETIDNLFLKFFSILAFISSLTGVILFFRSRT